MLKKASYSFRITGDKSVASLHENGEQHYIKTIDNNNTKKSSGNGVTAIKPNSNYLGTQNCKCETALWEKHTQHRTLQYAWLC